MVAQAIMLHLKDLAKGFYPFPQNKPGLVLVMANSTYGLSAAQCNAHAIAKARIPFSILMNLI